MKWLPFLGLTFVSFLGAQLIIDALMDFQEVFHAWKETPTKVPPKDKMSYEKNPCCLGYVGDYTRQLNEDYNTPLQGSLSINQDSMESTRFFRGSKVSKEI